ncbi:hypothetical protein [Spirulina sp. 06S082]|uniref:hypothetical protein n=1 Tax=Spirulina sp. 06S082 TaxID=3110248 RepID=UPI002B219AC3|nr:hypothetical protein [Spirulina sp. 06S082]MEA5468001.1 hypothetical protein [Spirulina sp. 06S082]
MGRPSKWNNKPTDSVRVPEKFIPQLLELARFLDGQPDREGFVQNPDPLHHCLFEISSRGEQAEISEIFSFPESLWDEADRIVDRALENELKNLSERELQQFIVLFSERIFKP